MKEFSKDEIKKFYKARVAKVVNYLNENKISLAVFIDNEEHRDPAIPYFTGHPSDAILIITSDGSSVLIPWDEILAKKVAVYSKMVPFTRYKCNSIEATKSVINILASKLDINKIALPPYLTYNDYLKFIDALNNYYVYCKENGVHQFVDELRMIKDEYEIECTKEAARIADLIIDRIEEQVISGQIKTEMDVALFIERECRIHGC
jgi:Xaa-Pro dipeptidase